MGFVKDAIPLGFPSFSRRDLIARCSFSSNTYFAGGEIGWRVIILQGLSEP